MAVGTPIITTRVGGNTELIEDNERGILLPYNDTIGFSKAVAHVFSGSFKTDQMTKSASNYVLGFTEARLIGALVAELERIIGGV
jgi:glycosyltransferase involved in cell wall biosynthesis